MAERRRPRYRYVVFSVTADSRISERELITLLGTKARLIHFDGLRGIVRCAHTAKEDTINFLNGRHEVGQAEITIRTIGTSGTIRKARMKFME